MFAMAQAQDIAVVPLVASVERPIVKLGKSARFEGTEIHLTEALEAQNGYLAVDMNGEADELRSLSFQYLCGSTTADTDETADGLSLSFGSLNKLGSKPEYGTSDGLVVSFIDFAHNSDSLYGVSLFYDRGESARPIAGPAGDAANFCDSAWHTVRVQICPTDTAAVISVSLDDVVQLSATIPTFNVAGNDLILAARTGAANAKHYVKNLRYNTDPVPACAFVSDEDYDYDYDDDFDDDFALAIFPSDEEEEDMTFSRGDNLFVTSRIQNTAQTIFESLIDLTNA